nr:MAG TPA: hypothetical protein [Caudoviricetes sp.]
MADFAKSNKRPQRSDLSRISCRTANSMRENRKRKIEPSERL